MNIEKDAIKHIANLARMRLSPEEEALFSMQLNSILSYMEKIAKVDVSNVEPTSHVVDTGNVFRDDTLKKSLSNTQALANAPDQQDGFFKVPRIIE